MRILLLNYEFPPMGGGAGHASFQLARRLVAQGCRVDVITSGLHGQPPLETINGVRIHRVRSLRRGIQDCGFEGAWSYVAAARAVFRRLLREQPPDVLHYFFGLPTGALSLCAPEARRIPNVVSLRGSDVPGYDTVSRPLQVAHTLLRPVTRRIWRRADAVVANSRWLARLAEQAVPGIPVSVIPNAISDQRFHPADPSTWHPASPARRLPEPGRTGRGLVLRHAQGSAPRVDREVPRALPVGLHRNRHSAASEVQLLTVVRLIPRKGVDDLLRAMALLQDVPVHLTIQGWGSGGDALQRMARSLGVAPRVTFAGFLARDLLPPVYQRADLFVLPSLSESCAMALLEALACGLPVVATRVGGITEHVEDGVNGLLVPPRDPAALARALRRRITDPSLRRALGARNAERVRQLCSWEHVVADYLAVYRRIIEARGIQGDGHADR